jgi:hypothetical protein
LIFSRITSALLSSTFDPAQPCVDYGGGYGVFVRLMRDRGYDFFQLDKYSPNLFAPDFEANTAQRYELLTSFEVFEHLVEPLVEVDKMLALADNILFSTTLLPALPPALDGWDYYGLDHGQHVGFYTLAALRQLARRFNLHLRSHGGALHLLSRKAVSPLIWKMVCRRSLRWPVLLLRPRESLTQADYQEVLSRIRRAQDSSSTRLKEAPRA